MEGVNRVSLWGKTVPGKYKGSQAEENLARSKTSQETSVAGMEWEQGRVLGMVREVGGGQIMQSPKQVFYPQLLHVTGEGGRKINPFLGAEIFAGKAMDNQELPMQFPKRNTFRVEDLQPK